MEPLKVHPEPKLDDNILHVSMGVAQPTPTRSKRAGQAQLPNPQLTPQPRARARRWHRLLTERNARYTDALQHVRSTMSKR